MQHQTETAKPVPMVLELFGHQRIAGYVSEHNFAGASFVRVDVPEIGTTPAFSKMFHPNAVYAFNPVDEETMLYVAEQCRIKPLTAFDLSEMRRKMTAALPQATDLDDDPGSEFDDEQYERRDDEHDGEEDEQKW